MLAQWHKCCMMMMMLYAVGGVCAHARRQRAFETARVPRALCVFSINCKVQLFTGGANHREENKMVVEPVTAHHQRPS